MTDRRREKLLPVTRWPTEAEARAARWFQPLSLGPITAAAPIPWKETVALTEGAERTGQRPHGAR